MVVTTVTHGRLRIAQFDNHSFHIFQLRDDTF
jgi:hypothetical protein